MRWERQMMEDRLKKCVKGLADIWIYTSFNYNSMRIRSSLQRSLEILEDPVYETKGKVVICRVLDTEGPNMEVTFAEKGTWEDRTLRHNEIPGYSAIEVAYYTEGKGVFMIKDVNEIPTWIGERIEHYSGRGKRCKFGILQRNFCDWTPRITK